jgi:hypothetical protein
MNSIPNELKLQILRRYRGFLPDPAFDAQPILAMDHDNAYNEILLRMALFHREWTALAQSELFHLIILVDGRKTELLLKLLREKDVFADYAKSVTSIRLGHVSKISYGAGLRTASTKSPVIVLESSSFFLRYDLWFQIGVLAYVPVSSCVHYWSLTQEVASRGREETG